jgi:ADP-ribosylation factor-like protein 5B
MWDVGGQESLRETWVRYFLGTHAVIFVVDSSDGSKLELNQEEFQRIVHHEELENACFLVFANKQDVAGALSEGQVSQGLALDTIRDRNYHIQACSALSGQGVNEGMDWLAHSLKQANGK